MTPSPCRLIFAGIFGDNIYDVDQKFLDLEFALTAAPDDGNPGFDFHGPHRERIIAWIREGHGNAARAFPLPPAAAAALSALPPEWEENPALHPAALQAAATAAAALDLPSDLTAYIMENNELWIYLK